MSLFVFIGRSCPSKLQWGKYLTQTLRTHKDSALSIVCMYVGFLLSSRLKVYKAVFEPKVTRDPGSNGESVASSWPLRYPRNIRGIQQFRSYSHELSS